MTIEFNQLGLSKPVLDALAAKGYTIPTPIQAQAIPPLLEGRDLLGIAQTGTGQDRGVRAAVDRPADEEQRAADAAPVPHAGARAERASSPRRSPTTPGSIPSSRG